MALSEDRSAQYTLIIDHILSESDLESISVKKIRNELQGKVDHDITPYKDELKALIHSRFEVAVKHADESADSGSSTTVNGVYHATNGTSTTSKPKPSQNRDTSVSTTSKREASSSPLSPVAGDEPPKKKPKYYQSAGRVEDDAAFAARLQAEENSRARPTRGSATRKSAPAKKSRTPKKKSASKVTVRDDSDLENSEDEGKEVERKGAFHKPLLLSQPLSALIGESQMSRPQVVKRIWEYVREKDLQNPSDKRMIICDDRMREVFKSDSVHMFTMNKILAKHLFAMDE